MRVGYRLKMHNLVIVPAGDNSLHETYCDNRDFELWAVYWGRNKMVADRFRKSVDKLVIRSGFKWDLFRSFCDIQSVFGEYDFVFCPDDDVLIDGAKNITRLFDMAAKIGADIFQPAISNEYYSPGWEATRYIPGLRCHATNIVEGMMPGFSGRIFSQCVLPMLHALPHLRVGFGFGATIMRMSEGVLGRPVRTFVIDAVPVTHTRPVGSGPQSHEVGLDEAFTLPNANAFPVTELARFKVEEEAARFEFPLSVPRAGALENSMNNVRHARSLLHRSPINRLLRQRNRLFRLIERFR
jgi:hypothetical protein